MYTEKKQKSPLVSVIMPAYNAEPFVQQAIGSVLCQTEADWELFVIDDCSRDGTFEAAKAASRQDPRVRVMRNAANLGVAKTRNIGIELARGRYIAFLDSDDIWHPKKLSRQIEKMTEKNADTCYCSYAIIGPSGNSVRADYIVPEQVCYEELLKENVMQCSAMLIRADIAKEIRFNTDFFHEDYILGLDILRKHYRAAGCTDILLSWRYLENSRSFNKWKAAKNRWRIYRNYLKLPVGKSFRLFINYTAAGLRKYLRKSRCVIL